MDFHGHINLQYNKINQMVIETETDFPQVPKVGRIVFKDQVLYICVALNGSDPLWIPITNKINTYIHTQSPAASSWTITHNLNTTIPVVQVYDSTGSMLIPNNVTPNNNNEMIVDLGEATTGTAIVTFGSLMPNLGIGILEPFNDYANLIGYFKFNETTGTNVTEEISSNNGTLSGGVTINQSSNFGIGYTFDGVDGYVFSGNDYAFERTDPFSIALWIKPASVSTIQFIVAREQGSGNFTGYDLRITSAGKLNMNLVSTTTTNQIGVESTTSLVLDEWQYVVITYDGSSDANGVSVYINGVKDTTIIGINALSTSMVSSTNFNIGARDGSTLDTFSGSMDDVRIYDIELTASNVTDVYSVVGGG